MNIKFFSALLFAYFLFCSKSCDKNSSKDLKLEIIEATSESWVGGMEQTGRGINYTVKILIPYSQIKKISFDSMWVNGVVLPVNFSSKENNDTLILEAVEKNIPPKIFKSKDGYENKEVNISSKKTIPPVQFEGEAIVRYSASGKNDFLIIQKFHKLQRKNFPANIKE